MNFRQFEQTPDGLWRLGGEGVGFELDKPAAAKNMRNEIKKFRALTSKSEAEGQLSKLYSVIDKVAKRGIIHKNKAGNLKSKLSRFTAKLA